MKAAIVEQPNAKFRIADLDLPALSPGDVLVRIVASGVNPLDTKIRAGQAAHAQQPLPAVLGLDMAGIVERVGSAITNLRPGDEVYGMVGGVGGLQGTLAEFVVADGRLLARKPANLTMRQAAALPLAIITAWEGLVDRAHVHAGHKVLIHAGAGGVGSVAVQMALSFGAQVFATVSADKREYVQRLGATPIDYRTQPVESYVRDATGGQGFDIVYDTVGGATLDASFASVRQYTGHVLSALGWGTHALAPLSFRGASYSGVFALYPMLSGNGREHHGEILAEATRLAEAGKLVPLLNETNYSLENLEEAHAAAASGQSMGKVVVSIG